MIRKARLADVRNVQRLVNFYAKKDEMLPLSLNDLYGKIRDFYVYEHKGKVIGCGALHISWEKLGEIRSLAVQKGRQKKGVGKRIVKECIREARDLGIEKVFVLTYKPEYFKKFGFKGIDKYQLPHKVWTDCVKCVHFPDCTEDALIKNL